MKTIKYLALTLVALVGMTSCSKDGDYDRTSQDTYYGYVYASFANTTDFYSGEGTMTISMQNEVYSINFSNTQWGKATFKGVSMGDEVFAQGTITVPNPHTGNPEPYDATLGGTLDVPVIDIPELTMNSDKGTTLTFYMGSFPTEKIAKTFSGTNSVAVGDWTGNVDIIYKITPNEDGSINLIVPEYLLSGVPVMGDMTLGTYTITNIPFSREQKAFQLYYGYNELKEHIKAENHGTVTMNNDFTFSPDSYIKIEATSTGIKVTNSFSFGNMAPIVATFQGKVVSAQ